MAVETLQEASQAAADFRPVPVTLKDGKGETLLVDKPGWFEMLPVWNEVKGPIKQAIRLWKNQQAARKLDERAWTAYMPGGMDNPLTGAKMGAATPEQTQVLIDNLARDQKQIDAEQDQIIDMLVDELTNIPDTLLRFVSICTNRDPEFFKDKTKCSWSDVLKLAGKGLRVNFFENEDLRDFSAAVPMLLGSPVNPEAAE